LNERKQGKNFQGVEELRQAAEAIVKKRRVEGLLNLSYEEITEERWLRRYGDRPAGVRVEQKVRLNVEVDAA
jgi:hypothetical protein